MTSSEPTTRPRKRLLVLTTLLIVVAVGLVDYATGYEISFAAFYLVAICIAVWYVGGGFGYAVSALSIVSWLVGDWAAGARYHSPLVPAWNAAITMVFYVIVVWLLGRVRSFQATLESRVRERTRALVEQMAESERLEKELLGISEREQRRFSHDLHDGLCQQLLGTAIATQVLARKLEAKAPEEARSAAAIVRLVEEAMGSARTMAHGLSPLDRGPQGLADALDALAASTRELFQVDCTWERPIPAPAVDAAAGIHLYRIAQEAISNAIRHGRADEIAISLQTEAGEAVLSVTDNGLGFTEPKKERRGMGLRIMKYRAGMIGGMLDVGRANGRGTVIACRFRPALASFP
jgi:signal transduction histidine kinase